MAIKMLPTIPKTTVPDIEEPVVPEIPDKTVLPDKYADRKKWWTDQYQPPEQELDIPKKKGQSFMSGLVKGVVTPVGSYVIDAFKDISGITDPGSEQSKAVQAATLKRFDNNNKANWFLNLYNLAPGMLLEGEIQSYEDYVGLFGTPEGMTAEDINEVKNVFGDVATDWLELDPEKESAMRKFFVDPVKEIPPNTVQRLTVQAILQSLAAPKPSLPEGMTEEEMFAYLPLMDLPPESIQAKFDIDMAMDVIVKADLEQRQLIKDARNKIIEWEQPSQSTWDRVFFTVQSPLQSFANFLAPYMRNVSQPLAGIASMYIAQLLPGTQGIEEKFNQKFYGENKNVWSSYGEAFDEWDIAWYYKLPIELITDPINFIPGVGLTIPGKVLTKVGLKTFGTSLISLNKGLWIATDIPFDLAKKSFASDIWKTPMQLVGRHMQEFNATIPVAVGQVTGKALHEMTSTDLAQTLRVAAKSYADTPNLDGSVIVDLGRYLADHVVLDSDQVYKWSTQYGGKLTPETAGKVVPEVNDVLTQQGMKVFSAKESASRLADSLMIPKTRSNLNKLEKEIPAVRKKLSTDIETVINIGKNSNITPFSSMIDYMVTKQRAVIASKVAGKYAEGKTLEGIMLGIGRKVDAITNNRYRLAFDRWLVRPFAEANLASLSYMPWNAFEGIAVTAIEGVRPGFKSWETYGVATKDLMGDVSLATKNAGDVYGIFGAPAMRPSGAYSLVPNIWRKFTVGASDVISNGIKRNYVVEKMNQHMATMMPDKLGDAVFNQIKKDINAVPKIPKKSLGLSSHELKQEMYTRWIAGSDALSAMKTRLTDGSLMNAEAEKIIKNADMLSPKSRALAEQYLADGKIFRKIDVELEQSHGIGERLVEGQLMVDREAIDAFYTTHDTIAKSISVPNAASNKPNATLMDEMGEWIIGGNNTALQNVGKVASTNPEYRVALHAALMEEYPSGYISIFRGRGVAREFDPLEREFVNVTSDKNIAQVFEDTWIVSDAPFTDAYGNILKEKVSPTIDNVLVHVDDVIAIGSSKESEMVIRSEVLKSRMASPIKPSPIDGISDAVDDIFRPTLEGLKLYPQESRNSFRQMADDIETTNITNSDELMQIFNSFETMSDTASVIPHRMMSDIMEQADIIYKSGKLGKLNGIWEKGRQDMLDTMDSITADMSRIRAKILSNTDTLTTKQLTAMEAVLKHSEASQLVREVTLRQDAQLLDNFWALPKSARTAEEHTALRAYRKELWANYSNEVSITSAGEAVSRTHLHTIYHDLPKAKLTGVDASSRALSAQDVANVFGTNIDGLATGLLDNIAMQGREYFIQLVKQSADDNAVLFRGFTEDKIGAVYDQLLRQANMNPELDILTQKILQQSHGMKQQLATLKMTHSISPATEKSLMDWIDNAIVNRGKIIGDVIPQLPARKSKVGIQYPPDIPARDYWDNTLEYNKLRTGYTTRSNAASLLAIRLENAGDMLREMGKDFSDEGYFMEKLTRIRKSIGDMDWKMPLSGDEKETIKNLKSQVDAIPATTEMTTEIKVLIQKLLDRDMVNVETSLAKIENLSKSNIPTKVPETGVAQQEPIQKVNWGITEFRKSVTPEIRSKLDELASILPNMPEIRILTIKPHITMPGKPGGYSAKWIESEKIMQLIPGFTPEDFYHEMGHALYPNYTEKQVEEYAIATAKLFKQHKMPETGVGLNLTEKIQLPKVDAVPTPGLQQLPKSKGILGKLEGVQEKLGTYEPKFAPSGEKITTDEWNQLRQKALDLANKDYYKAFADYSNEHMLGAMMKMIYPYWGYHQYRWFELSRQAIRHPGLATTWGKYQDYSENGFIPSYFPNLEMNLFTGSMMGTTFTLTRSDYASYFEQLGFAGEVLDYTQRWGYYPNAPITAVISLLPILAGRKPELGGVLPPIGKTGLDLMVASNIPGVSKAATWLKDNIFHENFHEYYTATILDSMQVDSGGTLIGGQTGTDLWFKMLRGEKLTQEEQDLWDSAYRKAAEIGVLRSQFPQFRLRTDDYKEAYDKVTQIFVEQLGMSEEFQKELWRNHQRPTDVVGGLPLNLQAELDELWQWKTYLGRGTILAPPEVADLKALIDKYWKKIESYQTDRLSKQGDLDAGFISPTTDLHFTGKEWRSEFASNWGDYASKSDSLETDSEFADAVEALTPEGQLKLAKRLGYTVTPDTPLREAVNLYFSIKLEKKIDPYTGEVEDDFLTFWLKREAVRRALTPEQLDEFDTYIRRYQTPMELTFHYAYNTYIRGYKASDRIVFTSRSEADRAIIQESYSTTVTLTRREELRSLVGKDGRQIISGYEADCSAAREALRIVSPKLDFYLYVFGYTTTAKTKAARSMIDAWEADRSSILITRE
ncbi:MAG: hypothetical protein WC364_05730 [Eubacteriales bacterium]|jgi:hypothetical protein